MDQRRREKLLRVVDGDERVLPLVFHFNKLRRCDDVLNYCIKYNVTGKNLLTVFQDQKLSILNVIADILRRVDNTRKKSRIIAGKDYF